MAPKGIIHIVGIAGSGMCAVAEVSLACGYAVHGSDRYWDQQTPIPVLARLEAAGCAIFPQDGTSITAETRALVISTAIEVDNPDLIKARSLAIPIYHRTEWLQMLIGAGPLLGVAGTSGKSTVTAMVGWILEHAGLDPFVVNGAAVSAWEGVDRSGQVRMGSQSVWVLELDESDRSLLRFRPQHAVITNQSADHFSYAETEALFAAFRQQVAGTCVMGPWKPEGYKVGFAGCSFHFAGQQYQLPLLGQHNAENAVAATVLCQCIGVAASACATALRTFPGVRRRLERYPTAAGISVFDDFAHNPAKISAAIETVLPCGNALTVVWRPHGYGPLRSMMHELVAAFSRLAFTEASTARRHRLLLLPVYDVGGTATRDVQAGDLAARLRPLQVATDCLATYDEVIALCSKAYVHAGDAVLVMGARDPGLPALARQIAAVHAEPLNERGME